MTRRLFAAAAFLLVPLAPLTAATPKEAALEKQLQAAQTQFNQMKQQIATLQAQNAKLQEELKKEKVDDKTDKVNQQSLAGITRAGLVHVVVFKAKSDTPSDETQALIDGAADLRKIKTVRALWVGKPSDKGTPDVAGKDYTVALTVAFDDAAGLKKYLDDPAHKKFADKHLKKWETPVVYDFEPKKGP